jgi:hypothetical protein
MKVSKKTPTEIETRKAKKKKQRQEGNKESCHQRQHTQTRKTQDKNK